MEKGWFNLMLSKKKELEYGYRLSKSMGSLGSIENTSVSEDPIRNDIDKNTLSGSDSDNSSYSNVDHLVGVRDIHNFVPDDTFLVRANNRDSYFICFDIENNFFEIDNAHSFLNELESSFSNSRNFCYLNSVSNSDDPHYDPYVYDTKYSWNKHITSCIDNYFRSQICIDSYILSGIVNYNDNYISSYIFYESRNSSETQSLGIKTSLAGSELTITETENSNDLDFTKKYRHLWVQCESCYGLNYKKFLK